MIRITFISDCVRSFTDEYDTDDLAEALTAQFTQGFTVNRDYPADDPKSNRGPDKWVFGFIVERDGEPVAALEPVEPAKSVTFAELFKLLSELPPPDDRFADDLEAIQASQSVTPIPKWPS